MRKAVQLHVTLWVEGEDEPAHNFAELAIQAVRDLVKTGGASSTNLRFRIKRISEQTEDEDESTEAGG